MVYLVRNFDGFMDFRNTNYPDATNVWNSPGFYHLAYYSVDSKDDALLIFDKRESSFLKS